MKQGGKVKVEKTENHEFIGKYSLNLANFDKTLLHTSLRPKQSCQKSWKISLDFHGLVERSETWKGICTLRSLLEEQSELTKQEGIFVKTK